MKSVYPAVTVICVTYNHVKYIREALDSFLMQKTDFPFEIVVHDDASTDGTQEVLLEYKRKFPKIVKLQLEKKNQYSQGNIEFITKLYKNANGKYIAHCEGDDYWTDSNKLQAQFDFMESNPGYAVCFHPVSIIQDKKSSEKPKLYPVYDEHSAFTFERLLKENYIQSNSAMFRYNDKIVIPKDIMPIDWYLNIYYAHTGNSKIGFLKEPMSVYRRHEDGVWWQDGSNELMFWKKNAEPHIRMHVEVIKLFADSATKNKAAAIAAAAVTMRTITEVSRKYADNGLLRDVSRIAPDILAEAALSIADELSEYKNLYGALDQETVQLREDIDKMKRHALELEKGITTLENQLEQIYNSKRYKVGEALSSIVHLADKMKKPKKK